MNKKILAIVGIISLLLFSGCASSGVSNIQLNNIPNTIDKSVVLYASTINQRNSYFKTQCDKKVAETYQNLSKNKMFENELKMRDVKITHISQKPQYITKVVLNKFESNDSRNTCNPSKVTINISIEDISKISFSWNNKVNSKTIVSLFKDSNEKKVIWKGDVTLVFKENTKLEDLAKLLMKELDKTNIFPSKTKSLEEVKKIDVNNSINECKKNSDSLDIKYNPLLKTLCVGKVGFLNVEETFKTFKKEMVLPLSTSIKEFTSKNNVCSVIKYIGIDGKNIKNNALNFKRTYLEQIKSKYKNKCEVNKINDLNFLICKENNNNYFIEKSEKDDNKIVSKKLLQVDRQCFTRFRNFFNSNEKTFDNSIDTELNSKETSFGKSFFETESKQDIFNLSFYNGGTTMLKKEGKLYYVATKYYGNKDNPTKIEKYHFFVEDADKFNYKNGKFNFFKKIVNSYNNKGYDKNGFNKKGFDKNGFNKFGFDINKLDKNGYNKDGWNPTLRIYGKQIFDEQGYDQNGYNKDGLDKDGYNRNGWNEVLKKFKKR